jgi:2-methylisocitrate lyase-like PEP mutase family enzyme
MHTTTAPNSVGDRFWQALEVERPLQVVGVINAYAALLAARAGFRAIYLSGAGVANASFGLPDLGMTSLTEVCEDVRRITGVTDLPLIVDADTGWGGASMIASSAAPARPVATSKTRYRANAADTVPANAWSLPRKCATASK